MHDPRYMSYGVMGRGRMRGGLGLGHDGSVMSGVELGLGLGLGLGLRLGLELR